MGLCIRAGDLNPADKHCLGGWREGQQAVGLQGGGGGVGRRKLFVLELLFPASGLLGPTGFCLPPLYSHQGRSLKGLAWGLVPAPDARRLGSSWTLPRTYTCRGDQLGTSRGKDLKPERGAGGGPGSHISPGLEAILPVSP